MSGKAYVGAVKPPEGCLAERPCRVIFANGRDESGVRYGRGASAFFVGSNRIVMMPGGGGGETFARQAEDIMYRSTGM